MNGFIKNILHEFDIAYIKGKLNIEPVGEGIPLREIKDFIEQSLIEQKQELIGIVARLQITAWKEEDIEIGKTMNDFVIPKVREKLTDLIIKL